MNERGEKNIPTEHIQQAFEKSGIGYYYLDPRLKPDKLFLTGIFERSCFDGAPVETRIYWSPLLHNQEIAFSKTSELQVTSYKSRPSPTEEYTYGHDITLLQYSEDINNRTFNQLYLHSLESRTMRFSQQRPISESTAEMLVSQY